MPRQRLPSEVPRSGTKGGAPWWMYPLAVLFFACLVLMGYSMFWGPERLGVNIAYTDIGFVVRGVEPDGPAARAGLKPGDRLVALDGMKIRQRFDWNTVGTNLEVGRTYRLRVERAGAPLELEVRLGRHLESWGRRDPLTKFAWVWTLVLCLLMFSVGVVIAFKRPDDPVARAGAGALAGMPVAFLLISSLVGPFYGWAAYWRQLPTLVGALLWIPGVIGFCAGPLLFTFCCLFPRKFFQARWPWLLVWSLVVPAAPFFAFFLYVVYRPEGATDLLPEWYFATLLIVAAVYTLAALTVLVLNYRRLEDINERRRVRVLVAGTVASFPLMSLSILGDVVGGTLGSVFSSAPVLLGGLLALALLPLSFAYAILRHRVFDIGVMVRQGLQYGLARRVLVGLVPALAAILVVDLLLHADQPLVAILQARGWVYAVVGGLAAVAHLQRQKWLTALDRRFFRERYAAQRLLREMVEEVRGARSFEKSAPRVVAQIEAALHPEFAALLVREPKEAGYRTLAAAPAGQAPPPLPVASKLVALLRLLNKPLEVPQTESGWLQQQLPHEETDFLRRARIDLLVPIAVAPERTEALLALGPKRAEEPYGRDDQDLLVAIASSLALLLEKPVETPAPVRDAFEECPQCGACYDSGIGRCAEDRAALAPVRLPRLLAERYRMDRRLGRGGMGTVYAATDTALERPVAVKVIREDLVGSAEAAERFRREARAAASFTHPNVVTVHDFGVAAETRAFLVMELLEGRTLRQELQRQKRLSAARTLDTLRGVAAAVEAAHRRQLIHRDLKPENIFLVRSETGEVPKVLDFGVAKFLPAAGDSTLDTGTGLLVGTLHYMAPEQVRGEPVDLSWDLWALAVIAYELLTGARPFAGAGAEWQGALLAGRFTPIAQHLPEAPPRWQEFFARALALEPAPRPNSAREFLAEFEQAFA